MLPVTMCSWNHNRQYPVPVPLKGQCHEIFDLCLFSSSIPSGPLINRLTHFCIWLRIREVIRQSQCTSGVNDTVGAASVISAMQTFLVLVRYDTAGAGDLEFERLWLPLKGIPVSIKKKLHTKIVLPNSYKNYTTNIGVI
jgi:hypothetical protein